MKLIGRHLTRGLIYLDFFRLIPALVGTITPFFWQLVNLYGTLPAVLIIFGAFQLIVVSLAAVIYPCLLFKVSFMKVYGLAVLLMAAAVLSWLFINVSINRRAGFKLFKLQFSTRTALLLLGLMLGNRLVSLPVSPRTLFWDLHLKPHLAGQLKSKSREEIIAAIQHDYQQAKNLMPNYVFFGCSPGSFKELLLEAGLQESQFVMMETIIPSEHARVFGIERPFYFYVLYSGKQED
jgi:hypothetical protein